MQRGRRRIEPRISAAGGTKSTVQGLPHAPRSVSRTASTAPTPRPAAPPSSSQQPALAPARAWTRPAGRRGQRRRRRLGLSTRAPAQPSDRHTQGGRASAAPPMGSPLRRQRAAAAGPADDLVAGVALVSAWRLLRPGQLAHQLVSRQEARVLPLACDLRAFNYIHGRRKINHSHGRIARPRRRILAMQGRSGTAVVVNAPGRLPARRVHGKRRMASLALRCVDSSPSAARASRPESSACGAVLCCAATVR